MRQMMLTFIGRVDPGRGEELEALLAEVAGDLEGNQYIRFGAFRRLHFASLVVFPDEEWGPYLVCEINFDGPLNGFLKELLEHGAEGLYRAFRCCVDYPPNDGLDRPTLARYLRSHVHQPHAFHIGNPGRSAERIRKEADLREEIQRRLDAGLTDGTLPGDAPAIRRSLQSLVADDPAWSWVPDPPPRLTPRDRWVPRVRLAAIASALVGSLPVSLPVGVVWAALLRRREKEDVEWSGPPRHEHLHRLGEREDRAPVQNHMASISVVKPGRLRRTTLRLVLWAVNAVARLATDGKLSGIPSIHYAHWSQIDDGRRLLFLTNFDGSWENYLDDFIDKASTGLTAVWSNSVGFPRTRFLFLDGARDGDRFKAVARDSQVYTNVWYSAYRELTVQQIDRNSSIREGFMGPASDEAALAWVRSL